jgi:hypothetical protein
VSPDQPHLTPLRSVLIGVKDLLRALLPVLKSREMRDQIAARAWRSRARTSVLTVLLLAERRPILQDSLRGKTRGRSVSFVKERRAGGDCSRPAQLPKLSIIFDGWRSGRWRADGPPGAVAPLLTPGPLIQAMSTEPKRLNWANHTEPRTAHLKCTVTG